MIYLFTALYDEAYPFLQYYKMKKEINSLPFEMYRCEEQQICLTITGTGEITAATVVAAVCAMGHVKAGDIFVQCGICAGAEQKKGVAYLCSKITEEATQKTFYPDISRSCGCNRNERAAESKCVRGTCMSESGYAAKYGYGKSGEIM